MSRDQKRNYLVNLAIEIMNRNGIVKTTLDDIAAEAGIATPSMYYYFKSKNDVVKEAVFNVLESARNNINESLNTCSSLEEQPFAIAKALYLSTREAKFVIGIDAKTKSEIVVLANDLIEEFNKYLRSVICRVLESGCETGVFFSDNPELCAELITSSLWGLLEKAIGTSEHQFLDKKIDALLALFMNGIKTR
jgi:AcrR family transcriptional regulator